MEENFASESYMIITDSEEPRSAIERFFRQGLVKVSCIVVSVLILLAVLFALFATLITLPIILLGLAQESANTHYLTTDYMRSPGIACMTVGIFLLVWGIIRYRKELKSYLTSALLYSGPALILGGWFGLTVPVPVATNVFTLLLIGSLTGIIVVGACIAFYWGITEKIHPYLKGLLKAGAIYAGFFGLISIILFIFKYI